MTTYTYKVLDHLPFIPEHLIAQAYKTLDDNRDNQNLSVSSSVFANRFVVKDGITYPSTYIRRFPLNEEFQSWIRKNIVTEWNECSIARTLGDRSPFQGPHTDLVRCYVLMYILENGGDNCTTAWYQEKGKDFYRPGKLLLTVDDYDLLDERDRVQLPTGSWAIINTEYLHAVENIEKDRIAVHLGLDTDKFVK